MLPVSIAQRYLNNERGSIKLRISESDNEVAEQNKASNPFNSISIAPHTVVCEEFVSLSKREFKAFLPFVATISFKAQRWTSWPHRDLGKRLRTRASENSLRTAISSALEVNKSSLCNKKTANGILTKTADAYMHIYGHEFIKARLVNLRFMTLQILTSHYRYELFQIK